MNNSAAQYSIWSIASLVWVILVVVLYLGFNQEYFDALMFSPFIGAAVISGLVFMGLTFILNQWASKLMNGLTLWLGTLVILCPLLMRYDTVNQIVNLDSPQWITLIGSYALLCLELLLFTLVGYAIGDRLLRWRALTGKQTFYSYWCIALGFAVLTLIAMLFAAFSMLNQLSMAILFLLAVGQNFFPTLRFARSLILKPITKKMSPKKCVVHAALMAVLLFTLSVNLLYNLKAFPIGWDALSYYLNVTQQIVETGALPSGYQAYNASLLASVGSVLFQETSAALGVLVLGGILSTGMIYSWVKKWSNATLGLLAAVWFYTLPNIVYLSTKDIKIDLFLLFILLTTTSLFIHTLRKKGNTTDLWIIIGGLCGFSLGIKYTSLFFISALLCGYIYKKYGWLLTTAIILSICGFFMLTRIDSISGAGFHFAGSRIFGAIVFIAGLSCVFFKGLKNESLVSLVRLPAILIFSALITFSPWMIKNGIEQEQAYGIRLLFGKGQEPRLDMDKINEKPVSPESVFMQFIESTEDVESDKGTSRREEIQRYLGYEKGALKFITLPADLAFNFNVKAPFVHIGYLFLLLLPILLTMQRARNHERKIILPIFLLCLSLVGLSAISYMALQLKQPDTSVIGLIQMYGNQFTDSSLMMTLLAYAGLPLAYLFMIPGVSSGALAYPIGILCIGLGGLLIQNKTNSWSFERRLFLWTIYAFSCLWWLFAGGIIWYGYIILAAMVILLSSYLVSIYRQNKIVGYTLYGSMGIWIGLALIMRLAALAPNNEQTAQNLWVSPMVNYASGAWSQQETLSKLSPVIAATLPAINAETDSRIYRVGTFMPYFIKNNSTRIYTDNQLDGYNEIQNLFDTKEDVASTLYKDDFRYIIVDLNTASIDKTPDASLQAKFKNFMNFLFRNKKLELIGTDRQIIVEQNGQRQAVPGLLGREYAHPGSIAVFKINP